jgi:pyruvate formate lyase activating enzyme
MEQSKLTKGCIFDIQGFSVHDGPGCRTLVFLKGCSLECSWCSNPEGISFIPEPLYRESRCTLDGLCIKACTHGAISICHNGESGKLYFDRKICARCTTYDCIKSCWSGALQLGGYEVSVHDIFATISRDRQYWGPGGGMTLTGGEPFTQPEFVHDLLKRCYDAYIHTAVETCGNVPWANYEISLPYIDWIFYDLKTLNESNCYPSTYQRQHNSPCLPVPVILDNARRLAEKFKGRIIFRLPVIPGFNDDSENIIETARFILSTGRNEINILPLHHLGREKYPLLGKKYYTTDFKIPDKDELHEIAQQFASMGIKCYIGSETPF